MRPIATVSEGDFIRRSEIDRLNEKFTILRGIEVDILWDGGLDLPDLSLDGSALRRCDPVHAVLNRSGTARLAHGKRRAEYPATCRVTQAAEALSPVRGRRFEGARGWR